MSDVLFVRGFERFGDLPRVSERCRDAQRPWLDFVGQRLVPGANFIFNVGNYTLAASGARRSTPSQRATTAAARQLPIRFTEVRAMSINVSTPRINATPSAGRLKLATVAARITSEA